MNTQENEKLSPNENSQSRKEHPKMNSFEQFTSSNVTSSPDLKRDERITWSHGADKRLCELAVPRLLVRIPGVTKTGDVWKQVHRIFIEDMKASGNNLGMKKIHLLTPNACRNRFTKMLVKHRSIMEEDPSHFGNDAVKLLIRQFREQSQGLGKRGRGDDEGDETSEEEAIFSEDISVLVKKPRLEHEQAHSSVDRLGWNMTLDDVDDSLNQNQNRAQHHDHVDQDADHHQPGSESYAQLEARLHMLEKTCLLMQESQRQLLREHVTLQDDFRSLQERVICMEKQLSDKPIACFDMEHCFIC